MLRNCFTSGRQAIRLHSVGNGRPDACGIELDCFAICPCKHSYLFPRRFAARSLWLRVLHRLLVPPVVSRPKSRYICHRDVEIVDSEDSSNSLGQALAVTDNHGLVLLRSHLFQLVLELQCDAANRVSDIALTVCHRHGREVIHKLACFEWRRKKRCSRIPGCCRAFPREQPAKMPLVGCMLCPAKSPARISRSLRYACIAVY